MIPVTAKRIVLAAIGVAMGVLAIISLCFTVLEVNQVALDKFYDGIKYTSAAGNWTGIVSQLQNAAMVNGFSLLKGNGELISFLEEYNREYALSNAMGGQTITYVSYEWLNIFAQIFSIVLLVAAVAVLALAVVWFFLWKKQRGLHAVALSGLAFGALYMVMGLVYMLILRNAFAMIANQLNKDLPSNLFRTSCFLPFIFFAVLEIAYWVCFACIRERSYAGQPVVREGYSVPNQYNKQAYNNYNYNYAAPVYQQPNYNTPKNDVPPIFPATEINSVEALKTLKELYDAGLLTAEEFNEQKTICLYGNVTNALQEQWMLYQRGIISPDQYQAFMNHFNGWNRGMPGMQNMPPMPGAQNVPPRPGMQNMPPMGDAQNVPPVKAKGEPVEPAAEKKDASENKE